MNEKSFNKLYETYVDSFFRYLKGHYFVGDQDAQDIIAETFCKIRDKRSSIKQETVHAYVWTVFTNTAKDFFKKNKLTAFTYAFDETHKETLESTDKTPAQISQDQQERSEVAKAIWSLDQESQDIIFWKYAQQRSHEDIAQMLWLTVDNVRKKLSRANKKVQGLTGHIFD